MRFEPKADEILSNLLAGIKTATDSGMFARVALFLSICITIAPNAWSANFEFSTVDETDQICMALLSARPSIQQQVLNQGLTTSGSTLSRNEFLFAPNYDVVAQTQPVVTVRQMQEEKSMFSATPEFANKHGGPIVRDLIAKIPTWYYSKAKELGLYPNIDVRVHNLSLEGIPEGFDLYPAIPGWHADGEFRETYFAQPDLNKVPVSFHVISTISTNPLGVSNTQFLVNPVKLVVDKILPDSALWQHVHQYVESLKEKRKFADMKDGNLIMFDARSLHRAMPVKESGWRIFFRMSMWHKPNIGEGQLGKQEQLYLLPKPGTKTNLVSLQIPSTSPSKIIGTFQPTATIPVLAEEQSVIGASSAFILKNGGPVAKQLISQLPASFLNSAKQKNLKPVFDLMVFRLYPGYRPFFPDYNGFPKAVGWHTSDENTASSELWMSVSSHEQGVNNTEFKDISLSDGQMLLVSSSTPRRETPAKNRGWRLMMRVRLVSNNVDVLPKIITQQYVDPGAEDSGW